MGAAEVVIIDDWSIYKQWLFLDVC